MIIVHVQVRVLPGVVDAFIAASLDNARQSVLEPGIARFDVLQHPEDSTRFLLVEVYRSPEAPAQHKETAHYRAWRDIVAPMMAEPRKSEMWVNRFPEDGGW